MSGLNQDEEVQIVNEVGRRLWKKVDFQEVLAGVTEPFFQISGLSLGRDYTVLV